MMPTRTVTTVTTRSAAPQSHRVTATAIVLNTGAFRTLSGFIRLLQLICGIVATGLLAYEIDAMRSWNKYEFSALMMSVYAMISTFCIVLSMLLGFGFSEAIQRSIFEKVYHSITFLLLLVTSILLLVHENEQQSYRSSSHSRKVAAGAIMLTNAILHLLSFMSSVNILRCF